MKLSRSVETECESRFPFRSRALHLRPVLVAGSEHQAHHVGSELASRSAGYAERDREFQFAGQPDMSRGWLSNQGASVNRRYRLPLGVGWEFGRVSRDSAHLTAPVTELWR
jgi:hypothetical protein